MATHSLRTALALKRAGIDRNTKDPRGGAILRDSAGEPTGMLVDEAMELVRKLISPRTRMTSPRRSKSAQENTLNWAGLNFMTPACRGTTLNYSATSTRKAPCNCACTAPSAAQAPMPIAC